MKKLRSLIINFSVLLLPIALFAAEADDNTNFVYKERILGLANIVSLKYIPLTQIALFQRLPNIDEIRDRWTFNIVTKCPSNCLDWPSVTKVQDFLDSGRARNGECPLPYFAILGFRSSVSSYNKEIYVGSNGRCFKADGMSYDTNVNILEFIDGNVITIFSEAI